MAQHQGFRARQRAAPRRVIFQLGGIESLTARTRPLFGSAGVGGRVRFCTRTTLAGAPRLKTERHPIGPNSSGTTKAGKPQRLSGNGLGSADTPGRQRRMGTSESRDATSRRARQRLPPPGWRGTVACSPHRPPYVFALMKRSNSPRLRCRGSFWCRYRRVVANSPDRRHGARSGGASPPCVITTFTVALSLGGHTPQ